jgi:hypothetical protein
MSKQSIALKIVTEGRESNATRKQMIDNIVDEIGVSSGYASTLYNNARKTLDSLDTVKGNLPTKPKKNIPNPRKTRATTPEQTKAKSEVSSFDRATLRNIRADMERAMKSVADQYGITLDIGAMRFSDNEFSTRVTAKTGDGTDAARNLWVQYQFRHGMEASDFGREFESNGDTFRIAGFKPKGKKYPITAVRVRDGAKYKFPIAAVKRGIK